MEFTVGGRAECDIDSTGSWQNVTITAVDEAGGTYSVVSDLGIFVGAVPAVQVRAQAAARLATPNEDDGVLGTISEALGVIEAGGTPAKQTGGAQGGGGGGDDDDGDGAEPTPQNPKSSKKKKSHKQPSTKKSRMAVVEDSDDPVALLSMDPRMRNTDFRSDPGAEGLSRRGGGFDTVAAQQQQQQQQQQLQQPRGLASKGAFGESPSYGTVSMDDFDDIDPNMRPKDLCGDLSCTIA
jgi:hypothetical protein